MNNAKKTFKSCFRCGYEPHDMSDVTFGEFNENRSRWYCFDHVEHLWRSANPTIKTESDWWEHLEKTTGFSPRPK